MAPWRKLYRPGASRYWVVKPALPLALGAYQDTFMPAGPAKRISLRRTWNGAGTPPVKAPTAATAPGIMLGNPGRPDGSGPGGDAMPGPGIPGGEIKPPGGIAPGGIGIPGGPPPGGEACGVNWASWMSPPILGPGILSCWRMSGGKDCASTAWAMAWPDVAAEADGAACATGCP